MLDFMKVRYKIKLQFQNVCFYVYKEMIKYKRLIDVTVMFIKEKSIFLFKEIK